MMKKGTPIYYRYKKTGDTFPGVVIKTKKMIQVKINHLKGDKIIWANESNIEIQKNWIDKL